MIKFREKEYSTKLAKTIGSVKMIGNSLKRNPKSKIAIKKEAIKAGRAVEHAIADPGAAVSAGVAASIKNPVSVGGNIASKALMVAIPATAALPIGTVAMGLEGVLKKASPKYVKATEKLAKKYKGSRLSSLIKSGVNGAYTMLGGTPIIV